MSALKVFPHPDGRGVFEITDESAVIYGVGVATIWSGEDAEYHARLFAAAPELLAALEIAEEILEQETEYVEFKSARDQIASAIAKVKGGQG